MEVAGLIFNIIAGISAAATCILAFYTFFNFDKVKLKITKQTKNYKVQHEELKKHLIDFREKLFYNDITDIHTRSGLREELFYINKNFRHLLNKELKKKIYRVIKSLKNKNFDKEELCVYIDYIISEFRSDAI